MKPSWENCLDTLRQSLGAEDFDTWISPLQGLVQGDSLRLLAPNRYVMEYVRTNLLEEIRQLLTVRESNHNAGISRVLVEIGSYAIEPVAPAGTADKAFPENHPAPYSGGVLNADYRFATHVEGQSNQIARAAAIQVSCNPGKAFNPLFIYGGVGLGKTHLMHAVGNQIIHDNPGANVVYVHSELFVNDMVKALKNNTMNEFKRYYRSLQVLLIDDIQFFARKTQSQEEFFHTFNALLEGQRQIIITSDRIPKAINHMEERLISRFGWGLTVSIDPPELETRVAILQKKAMEKGIDLAEDVAFFVANIIRSNVRELEGALHRISANAEFTGRVIDIALATEALQDILVYQQKQIGIESIQQTVAEYFKIRISDLLSKKRSREIARPRQLAMAFAKEYTSLSLPRIGDRFGGRDHTTVLHACRKVVELVQNDPKTREDYENLQRLFGRI